MKAVIFGASGYGGAELIRSLGAHPSFEVVGLSGAANAGSTLGEIYPHLETSSFGEMVLFDTDGLCDFIEHNQVDIAFLALPNNTATKIVPRIIDKVSCVIDLSADFRLKDPSLYESYYGYVHPEPKLLEEAVYGLCELNRSQLIGAKLIAAPGCYVTASTLALFPFLDQSIIDSNNVVISAVSGVSGAGRGSSVANLFSEIDSNVMAYGLLGHRHRPEIEQNLGSSVLFIPHLVPMTRGILATCFGDLSGEVAGELGLSHVSDVAAKSSLVSRYLNGLLGDFYSGDQFVEVLAPGVSPRTKSTLGTNNALVSVSYDAQTNKVIVLAAIDNMVKGAAGQAIQAANIAFGLAEDAGLSKVSFYP